MWLQKTHTHKHIIMMTEIGWKSCWIPQVLGLGATLVDCCQDIFSSSYLAYHLVCMF